MTAQRKWTNFGGPGLKMDRKVLDHKGKPLTTKPVNRFEAKRLMAFNPKSTMVKV